MRFALPACKFEGLHLCHRFFYDLMSLVETISLNVVKEEIEINRKKDPEGLHSRVPQKALQIASPTKDGPDSVKGSFLLIIDRFVTDLYSFLHQ